jgi:hypothetical protein
MTTPRAPRPLDHCVLPVADLATARKRHEELGFTVAPDGIHPFGTENCCVYFADGTFLEPLAVGQRETAEQAAREGNAFVARDAAFRFRHGPEGFSAVVMGSGDAEADHARFIENGHTGGKILEFSREFKTPGGDSGVATFRLAFAADLRSPDAYFFTCQRINVPKADRSTLQRHGNGVLAIAEIVMSEPNPTDFQYLLQDIVNEREVEAHSFGMAVRTADNARLNVLNPDGMRAFYGMKASTHARGLRLRGIVFRCADLAAAGRVLDSAKIAYEKRDDRLLVQAGPGQGAFYAFEAAR